MSTQNGRTLLFKASTILKDNLVTEIPNLIFLNTLRFPFYISLTKPQTNVSKFLDCKPVLRAKFAISKQLSEDYSLK